MHTVCFDYLMRRHLWLSICYSAVVGNMSLIASMQLRWKLLNDHFPRDRTCKVFNVDVGSQANELFNLLGVSPDGGHVKGSLPSLVPLVDLVLLSRRGAAGDFLLHRGRLRGVTGSRVCAQAERGKHLIDARSRSLSQVEITAWIHGQVTGSSNTKKLASPRTRKTVLILCVGLIWYVFIN